MTELGSFTWRGEKGEPLRFADLTEAEQRVALIAAGASLRGRPRKSKKSAGDTIEASVASATNNEGGGDQYSAV
jgi:hypothetical protein